MKKILLLFSLLFFFTSCNNDLAHEHNICDFCNKCTKIDCSNDICIGHDDTHTHNYCKICNKCREEDCALDKCIGHEKEHLHNICEECGKCTSVNCTSDRCPLIHKEQLKNLYEWYFEIEFLDILKIETYEVTSDEGLIKIYSTNKEEDIKNLFLFFDQKATKVYKDGFDIENPSNHNTISKLIINYGSSYGTKTQELIFYDNIIRIDNFLYECNTDYLKSIITEQIKYKFNFSCDSFDVYDKFDNYQITINNINSYEFIDYSIDSSYMFEEYKYYLKTNYGTIYIYDEYTFNFNDCFYQIKSNNRFNFYNIVNEPIIINPEFEKVDIEELPSHIFSEEDFENVVFYKVSPDWIFDKYDITIYEAKCTHVDMSLIYVVKNGKKHYYYGKHLDDTSSAVKMLAISDINDDGFIEVVISCTGELSNKCLIYNTFNNYFDELYTYHDCTLTYKNDHLYFGDAMIKYGSRNRLELKENIIVYKCEKYTVAYFMTFQDEWDFYLVTEENLGKMTIPSIGMVTKFLYTGEEFNLHDYPNREFGENKVGPVPLFVDSEKNQISENAIAGPDIYGIDYLYPGLLYEYEFYLFAMFEDDNISPGTYDMELHFIGEVNVIEDVLIIK